MEEILKQILGEMQSMRKDMNDMKTDMSGLKSDVSGLKQDMTEVKQSLTKIENEHGDKISALYDAREVLLDQNERIAASQVRVESKLDRLVLRVN